MKADIFWPISGALSLMVGVGVQYGLGPFALTAFACLCAFAAGISLARS